jgi:hypothetical protein
MSTAKLFVGLCATCNNATHCVYRKRRGIDAIYCEMFDGYALPSAVRGKGVAPVIVTAPDMALSTEFKGLCVNCAHRDDCKLPRPEGGVWHCEEYE